MRKITLVFTSLIIFASMHINAYPDNCTIRKGKIAHTTGFIDSYPVISCPLDIVTNNDSGLCGAVVNFDHATAIDDEDGALTTTQTMGLVSGSVFPIGDTIIEFSATDLDGNTATCQFTITVNDVENPTVVCQDITVELNEAGNASISTANIDAGSSDNCTGFIMSIDLSSFDCSHIGENTVTLTVVDFSENTASCTATVIVLDVTAPLLVCGPEPLLYGENEVSESPYLEIPDENPAGVTTTISISDNFTLTYINVPISISHSWRGDLEISLTSPAGTTVMLKSADIDDSENDVWITYDDEGTPPAEALSVFDGESILGVWTLFVADQFSGDIGTINSWGLDYEYFYPNPIPDLIIELDADGTVTIEPDDILAVMEEACEIDIMLIDITEFSCDDIGIPTVVTIFANDTSGNYASCQVEVHIVDATEPLLTCPPDQPIPFDPATGLFIVPDYFDMGDAFATDSCTDSSLLMFTQTPPPGSVLGIPINAPHIITFTAEDEFGNIATCDTEFYVHCGVDENDILTKETAIYPNSATNQVALVNNSSVALEAAIIYDINGKLVAEIDLQDMQTETTFDVSNFASGVFMVKIIGENASTVKRLIKE